MTTAILLRTTPASEEVDPPSVVEHSVEGIKNCERTAPQPWPRGLIPPTEQGPISQEQLATEVKCIYAALTMVEARCIHIDKVRRKA